MTDIQNIINDTQKLLKKNLGDAVWLNNAKKDAQEAISAIDEKSTDNFGKLIAAYGILCYANKKQKKDPGSTVKRIAGKLFKRKGKTDSK
ncbi:MAG: hypothetical protein LBG97_08300 [Coriobacteriales bacterium]|jgi:hypothetical protein|nr:hypothetical protein [Coriobacteriales bacterium]